MAASINYPTSLDADATVGGGNEPDGATALDDNTSGHPKHSVLHQNVGEAIQAIQAKVGAGASTPSSNKVLVSSGTASTWGEVVRAMIAADAIDGTRLADNSVNSEHYVDRSIDAVHIATGAITANELATNSVGNDEMIDSPTFTSVTATTLTASGEAYVGANGGGDSWTHYYDDNSNTWRTFGWDDSSDSFYFESKYLSADLGSSSAPTITWLGYTNYGFYLTADTGVKCTVAGSTNWVATASAFHPGNNNTKNLGTTSWKWVDVWAVDGSINTSDERFKIPTGDVPGLDFVCDLADATLQGRWREEIRTEPGKGARTDVDHFWFGAQSTRRVLDKHGFGEVALVREPDSPNEQWSMAGMEVLPSMAVAFKELRDRVAALEAA